MNLNMCGNCIHCQLLSKWNITALNVRTLFVVTDLFHSIGAHVKSVHVHSKVNNALLHSSVCAQCCADRCTHLSLSKETDSTALRSPLYSFSWTSWCRETEKLTKYSHKMQKYFGYHYQMILTHQLLKN